MCHGRVRYRRGIQADRSCRRSVSRQKSECDRRVAGAIARGRGAGGCGSAHSFVRCNRLQGGVRPGVVRLRAARRLAGVAAAGSTRGGATPAGRSGRIAAGAAAEQCSGAGKAVRVHVHRQADCGAGAAGVGGGGRSGEGGGAARVYLYDDSAEAADRKMLEFLRMPNTPTAPSEWFQSSFDVRQQTAELAKIIEAIA
jgi:hypothetical protein